MRGTVPQRRSVSLTGSSRRRTAAARPGTGLPRRPLSRPGGPRQGGTEMKVGEVMTRQVAIAAPDDTLQEAAGRMAELDTGVLPVGEGDRLVGMLTDRDIAIRAVAQGKGPDAKVRDAMTADVKYCFDDEDLDDAVRSMGEQKVRRLPVMSRDKRLVGIVSLGDVAVYADAKQTDAAVSAVSEPGGPHTQKG